MGDMSEAEFQLRSGRLAGRRLMKLRCGKCGRVLKMDVPGESEPQRFQVEVHVGSGSGGRYRCHRRCGADWRVSGQRLSAALRDAHAAGRGEVVVGVDV